MKREAANHPKMHDLAARLGIENEHALGLVQRLIWFTADHAIAGDIGKWADGAIARGCGWQGPAGHFVESLTAAGWLDESADHRLTLHDWPDHAENWVKAKLAKAGLQFLPEYDTANAATPTRRKPAKTRRTTPVATPVATPDDPPDYTLDATPAATGEPSPNRTEPNRTKPNQNRQPPLPAGLAANSLFCRVWDEWLAYRKAAKLTRNGKTLQAQLAELEQHPPAAGARALQKSIANGWKGIFLDAPQGDPQANGKTKDATRDREMARAKIVKQMRKEGAALDEAEVDRRLAEALP